MFLDQALPIVTSLKELHPDLEILCLYANPGSIVAARPGWTPIRMLEHMGANSAYPLTPSRWVLNDKLTIKGILPKFVARASRLSYPHLYPIGRALRAIVSLGIFASAWLSQGQIARKIETLTQGTSCVIWDATIISKKYMNALLYMFRDIPSYSIRHGIEVQGDPKGLEASWKSPPVKETSKKITLFAMTFDDLAVHRLVTGVTDEQILPTGIFRHHPDWVRTLASQEFVNEKNDGRKVLLVVSRGYSAPDRYLPRERMLTYLSDIKTAAEKHDLRVIVKPHPKETDLEIHVQAFGASSRGVNWEISDLHLAILAQETSFAVSFLSGSCLDLTAYGVPTIERLNLIGLREYDLPSSIRDSTGAPIFQYRQNGHVIGSSTSEEFFLRVEEVISDRQKVMRQLEKAYARRFITPPMNPRLIAQEISKEFLDVPSALFNRPQQMRGNPGTDNANS